jgi:RNase P subunit RPR2
MLGGGVSVVREDKVTKHWREKVCTRCDAFGGTGCSREVRTIMSSWPELAITCVAWRYCVGSLAMPFS